MEEVFIINKSFKNLGKYSLKCLPSCMFSEVVQRTRLESLVGYFWPQDLMFDTPVLKWDKEQE